MPAYYSPGTVDQWPLNVVSTLLFGGMWNAPIPDLDRTDHLDDPGRQSVCVAGLDAVGARCDGPARRDPTARRQGRRRRPAPHSDRTAGQRVGADPAGHRRAVAVRHPAHPCREGWVRRPEHLRRPGPGLDEVIAMAPTFTPERVAAASGIDATQSADWPTNSRTPENPSSTAGSAPAHRNSARWPPGWCSS